MTRAEQEAFEKWKVSVYGPIEGIVSSAIEEMHKRIFLAGYRAGFEKGYYHIANPDEFTGEPDDA